MHTHTRGSVAQHLLNPVDHDVSYPCFISECLGFSFPYKAWREAQRLPKWEPCVPLSGNSVASRFLSWIKAPWERSLWSLWSLCVALLGSSLAQCVGTGFYWTCGSGQVTDVQPRPLHVLNRGINTHFIAYFEVFISHLKGESAT